jgi:hypothetical protein
MALTGATAPQRVDPGDERLRPSEPDVQLASFANPPVLRERGLLDR